MLNVQISMAPMLFFVLLGFVVLLLRHQTRKTTNVKQRGQAPILPQNQWLFGFDIAYQFAAWIEQGIALQESTKLITKHGRTFSTRFAGHFNICTADEVNVRMVLTSSDFELSSVRRNAFHPAVGNGMIATNGPQAAFGRKVLRGILTQRRVRDLTAYEQHLQNLFSLLPSDGSEVDLQRPLALLAMDMSTELLLGKSTCWLSRIAETETERINKALDNVTDTMRFRTDLGPLVHLHWNRQFKKDCKLLQQFVNSYLPLASLAHSSAHADPELTRKHVQNSYVQELVSAGSDHDSVQGHVLTSILAGRDTTASLIGFTVWNLARHPSVQKNLRKVIKCLDNKFSFDELSKVSYLWWTLKEGPPVYSP